MASIKIFKSQRGKVKVGYKGYSYTKDKDNVTTTSWKCDVKGCRGSLSTAIVTNENPVERQEHNHVPDPAKVDAAVAVSAMKERALETDHPPRRIASETFASLRDETLAQMPTKQNLRRTVQRKRRRDEAFPTLPQEVQFEVPQEFRFVKIDNENKRFLLFDTMEDNRGEQDQEEIEDRIIAFSTEEMLHLLSRNRHWMADGTFKVSPALFFQIFTIHAIIDDGKTVLPAVYCLMTSKRQDMYNILFARLKAKSPQLNPLTCVMDFEAAAHAALRAAFPAVQVQGCFFHLSQSIWRKIQDLGLRQAYIRNQRVRVYCKMLAALAFMEPDEVIQGFDSLDEEREDHDLDQLSPLYEYFEENYIGRIGRRGRRRPRFNIEMWNVRARCANGLPRTNNKLEGWHRGLQQQFTGDHPNVWRFFRGLQREQVLQHTFLIQHRAGHPGPALERRYQNVNTRLQNVFRRAHESDVDFLKAISHNLELNV